MRYLANLFVILALLWSCEWSPDEIAVGSEINIRSINLALGDTTVLNISGTELTIEEITIDDVVEIQLEADSTLQIAGLTLGKTRVTIHHRLELGENLSSTPKAVTYLIITVTDGIPLEIFIGEWTELDLGEYLSPELVLQVDSVSINDGGWLPDEGLSAHAIPQYAGIHIMGLSPGNHRLEVITFDSLGIQVAPLYYEVETLVPTVTLAEIFTNAGCVNCPVANHNLDLLYEHYPQNFTAIRYHVFWTDPFDPMNLYNPDEVEDRRVFYGSSWEAPRLIMDGAVESANDNIETLTALVNQNSESESEIHIWRPGYDDSNDSIFVSYRVQNFGSPQTNLVSWVVLTEDSIEYAGTNGEVIHMQVMRDMAVIDITSLEENVTLSGSLKKTPDFDSSEKYHIIIFVQDLVSKEVLQTVDYSTSDLLVSVDNSHGH